MHKDGSFEIRDISPGAYTILATVDNVAMPMMARQSLQLAESVDGLRLAPQTGGTIRGRLRTEAGGNVRLDPSRMFLLLHELDGDDEMLGAVNAGQGSPTLAHVNLDGSFEWKNVPAGRYSVQIAEASGMPDWFLKSVVAGGREALDSGFSLSGGVTPLDLLASANGATTEGVATNEKDEPINDAVVVAVPESRFRGRPERYRKAISDQSGHFTLRGLSPGNYTIFAWDRVDGEAYYNPEFLKSYEGQGKALQVNEGDLLRVQVRVALTSGDEP
jgi:hypothetical protein